MATVTYNFDVNTPVFMVDIHQGVREAVVKLVTINVATTGTTIDYTIQYRKCGTGTVKVREDKLYGTIDEALDAYRVLVLSNEC